MREGQRCFQCARDVAACDGNMSGSDRDSWYGDEGGGGGVGEEEVGGGGETQKLMSVGV